MLRARREAIRRIEEGEASGVSFWTLEMDLPVRLSVWQAWEDTVEGAWQFGSLSDEAELNHTALELIVRDLRRQDLRVEPKLAGWKLQRLLEKGAIDPASMTEALALAARKLIPEFLADFERAVNDHLLELRIGFELVECVMVEKESQEMHAAVVAPALRLLSGLRGWDKVETSYQKALEELHGGDPADAITDAGTALQEALVARGCAGNALGPLLKDARRSGILAAHDAQLEGGVAKMIDWVSADRSTKGDAHNADDALREDAWLTVHVVGALVLRLAKGADRGS